MQFLIIVTAKYAFLLSIAIAGGYFLLAKTVVKKKLALLAVISLPVTLIVARITSVFWYDPRPFVLEHVTPFISHAPDNGFPSDHTLLTMALSAIIFAYNKKLGVLLFVIALLVGSARVLAKVHHPIDILGSTIIAFVVTGAAYYLLSRFKKETKRSTQEDS